MLDPHFIIAEGFKLTKTRKMKTQTKTKEERFEKVVKYEEVEALKREGDVVDFLYLVLGLGVGITGMIHFAYFLVFIIVWRVLVHLLTTKRKVYWRRIK